MHEKNTEHSKNQKSQQNDNKNEQTKKFKKKYQACKELSRYALVVYHRAPDIFF